MLAAENLTVQAKDVSHYYRQSSTARPILREISLDVRAGEILAIVGASGCGKSTLLRVLAGLAQPTSGEILVAGDSPQQALRKHHIGLAFQKPVLFPWWTVLDNVLLPIRLRQESELFWWQVFLSNVRSLTSSQKNIPRDVKQQAITYLEQLGIGDTAFLYPHQLSGGMLQRAAIARALMGKPKVLVLDEPFSAVDEITRETLCLDFHQVWREQGLSVILVTHSIPEAVLMADRVLVMSRQGGTIAAEFPIAFGRDRSSTLIDSLEYNAAVKQIRRSL